jgi:hypothetical protein
MEHKSCLVLHPNAALVYKVDTPYIELKHKQFETQFGITGSEGLEHSSVDLQFEGRRARVRSLKIVQLNEEQDSITDGSTPYTGKFVSQEVVGDHLLVTLKRDGVETSYVGITKVARVKPLYAIQVSGEVNQNHDNVISLSTKTYLRYVLSSITTSVHYSLYLAKSDDEDAELEQTLFVRNNSGDDHIAFLCYNSVPYNTTAPQMRFESAYSTRSAPAAPNLDVLRPQTISVGDHTLGKEATIPIGLSKLPKLQLHFETFISLLSSAKSQQATPAIKIPLSAGNLVEGQLKIFDTKGYYLTAGSLKIGTKNARAQLRPVYYGVRVDAETAIEGGDTALTTRTALTVFNSGSGPTVLLVDYEKRLQFGGVHFVRESTRKIRLSLAPGKSSRTIELKFIKIKAER